MAEPIFTTLALTKKTSQTPPYEFTVQTTISNHQDEVFPIDIDFPMFMSKPVGVTDNKHIYRLIDGEYPPTALGGDMTFQQITGSGVKKKILVKLIGFGPGLGGTNPYIRVEKKSHGGGRKKKFLKNNSNRTNSNRTKSNRTKSNRRR